MDSVTLQTILDNNQPNVLKVRDQKRYFQGDNTSILLPAPKPDPDNRLPVAIPRRAVMLLRGYMLGPDSVQYSGDFWDESLNDIYDSNEEALESAEVFQDACTHGLTYELHWFGEDKLPHFYPVPADQAFPVWSNDLRPKLVGFAWVRTVKIGTVDTEICTYLDGTMRSEWVKNGTWQLQGEETPHFYPTVPVVPFRIDSKCQNLFDHVLPMVDALDKIVSGSIVNELERFASAYLLLKDRIDSVTKDANGMTDVDRLAITKTFDGLGDNAATAVSFLTKNINGDFIEKSADRLERLIYEMLMIQNPNDKDFGAGDSGVAQAWKAWGQELLAASVESQWQRGLQDRVRLIGGLLINLGIYGNAEAVQDVSITMTRNTPFALNEMADVAAKLKGILSDETIIALFPPKVIGSVKDELERLDNQEPEIDMSQETSGGNDGNQDAEPDDNFDGQV